MSAHDLPLTPEMTANAVSSNALFATAADILTHAERCVADAKRRYAEDQMAISHCMRLQREADRVSLRALARKMKLSAPYVSDLELGRRNWSQVTMANYRHSLDSLANAQAMASADEKTTPKETTL